MTAKEINAVTLLLDSNRGTYIPRDFVEDVLGIHKEDFCNTEDEDGNAVDIHLKEDYQENVAKWSLENYITDIWACLNPDSEWYWDSWTDILDNACFVETGHTLYQDGDLWALNVSRMNDEEKDSFGFEYEWCLTCDRYACYCESTPEDEAEQLHNHEVRQQ